MPPPKCCRYHCGGCHPAFLLPSSPSLPSLLASKNLLYQILLLTNKASFFLPSFLPSFLPCVLSAFLNSVYICETIIQICQGTGQSKKVLKSPSMEKTVRALWRCCNGLVIHFKEAETKARQQYYIAQQDQNVLLAATSLTCSNVAKDFKIMKQSSHWLICNLFLLRDVTCAA